MRSSSSSRQPKAPQVYQRLGFTEKQILQMAQYPKNIKYVKSVLNKLENGIPLGLNTAQFTTIISHCGPYAKSTIDALKKLEL